jgi:hypothetical protein
VRSLNEPIYTSIYTYSYLYKYQNKLERFFFGWDQGKIVTSNSAFFLQVRLDRWCDREFKQLRSSRSVPPRVVNCWFRKWRVRYHKCFKIRFVGVTESSNNSVLLSTSHLELWVGDFESEEFVIASVLRSDLISCLEQLHSSSVPPTVLSWWCWKWRVRYHKSCKIRFD